MGRGTAAARALALCLMLTLAHGRRGLDAPPVSLGGGRPSKAMASGSGTSGAAAAEAGARPSGSAALATATAGPTGVFATASFAAMAGDDRPVHRGGGHVGEQTHRGGSERAERAGSDAGEGLALADEAAGQAAFGALTRGRRLQLLDSSSIPSTPQIPNLETSPPPPSPPPPSYRSASPGVWLNLGGAAANEADEQYRLVGWVEPSTAFHGLPRPPPPLIFH